MLLVKCFFNCIAEIKHRANQKCIMLVLLCRLPKSIQHSSKMWHAAKMNRGNEIQGPGSE